MGRRIVGLFEEAERIGGVVARMRLASLAQLTSTEALTVEDRPETVSRVLRAMASLREELPRAQAEAAAGAIAEAVGGDEQTSALRRYMKTFVDLMAQRNTFLEEAHAMVRRINEAASSALGVQRVSVWSLDEQNTKLILVDLFDRATEQHESGAELSAQDFAPYFRALSSERTIAANDAHQDPRTSCFSETYLTPFGISSMLDVPIWVKHKMVGVVCHEHVGSLRVWNSDEESFAYLMASFVALALEREAE
jgi:hypothetical protein